MNSIFLFSSLKSAAGCHVGIYFMPRFSNHFPLEAVKTYMYLKVRLIFDPPTSGIVTESMNKMVSEYEWRLNVAAQSSPLKNGEEK